MLKKIAVAGISQETCSFNPVKTTFEDFKSTYSKEGQDVVNVPSGDGVIDGFCSVMKAEDCSLLGIISTKAMSGGALTAETFTKLKQKLLNDIKNAGTLDVVFLALHGAMQAENEFDTEGVLLSEVRDLVGKNCFIGVTLDHHANVTRKMVEAADVMVGYETQPHQLSESGIKTAKVILDIWANKREVRKALVKVPMLSPQDNFLTSHGPMKEWFGLARKIEKEPGIIVASTFPTQPWLDVPDNGWSCLVYAESQEQAQFAAEKLAQKAWDLREEFWRSERLSLTETIAIANSEPQGLVVISDTGDAAPGGAPGDNMLIAAEILKHDLKAPALVPVVDKEAFAQALKSGVGTEMTLEIGGKMSADYSPRLKITGKVGAVSKAGEITTEDGRSYTTGRAVLFEKGNLKIAILEQRDPSINHPTLYERLGIDVSKAQMVILKTGSNFQYFKGFRSRLLRADSLGVTQSDLLAFEWKNMTHPIYPFDDIKDWRLKK